MCEIFERHVSPLEGGAVRTTKGTMITRTIAHASAAAGVTIEAVPVHAFAYGRHVT